MPAYYNEFDPHAAQWLRNLIAAGHIADGEVDERSIVDVQPAELASFTQCHFFAGIGGWSLALRLAGWPDDRPVWTGSCPCQPFSAAGKRGGTDDERHLWPEFFRLIGERRPAVVFGEQVASKAGLAWLDLVSADLEGAAYTVGAADICAAGIGAPHIRQRLWWVANSDGRDASTEGLQRGGEYGQLAADSRAGRLEHPSGAGLSERERDGRVQREALGSSEGQAAECGGHPGGMADAGCLGNEPGRGPGNLGRQAGEEQGEARERKRRGHATCDGGAYRRPGPDHGFWRDADWLYCRDGKWRPVEPGTFPLAHGIPGRVGKLRAYGNAIVPQVAAEVIAAYMEI